ncbi:MAG: hypothetical protein L0229_22530 [Blastocatellia bacterium]|nr:hypothetical protein [Blastocatellia bacterium]
MNEIDNVVFSHPARVLKRAPSEQLLGMAKSSRALDPTIFDERPPFFWQAEISNTRLDDYYTHMHITSLRNFAADARDGRAFQDSHISRRLPLGQSLDANLQEDAEVIRALADFFTIPDLEFNDATYRSTNDFIAAVRAGISRDVSIGFYFHNTDPEIFCGFRCDICGGNLWSWSECTHFPGVTYETGEGEVIQRVVCTATVINARLSEVSAVYDGATPGAAILKAEREAESGRLVPEVARMLETRYRIKLTNARHFWPGTDIKGERSDSMLTENNPSATVADARNAVLAEVRGALVTAGHTPGDGDVLAFVRTLTPQTPAASEVESALKRALEAAAVADAERCADFKDLASVEGVRTIASLAADGRRYREDLIAEALAEGVRAHGDKFQEETYRSMLDRSDIDTIKRMRDDWKAVGDANFPGGRLSQDASERKPAIVEHSTPVRAFKM